MIELHQLEQLVAISKQGTISNAAKELLISQPALSRSMQRLEEELGVELFNHYKNKVILNKNGELAVEYAKKVLAQVNEMVKEVKELDLKKASLTIASCTPAPIWDIETLIKDLYQMNVISSIMEKSELVSHLKNKKVQMIIIPEILNDKDIITVPYLDEDLYLSIPQGHPLENKKEVSFRDLDGETMILYDNIGFWHDLHLKSMPKTNFILQGDRAAFKHIVKASTLPSFTTNLSIKREGEVPNRITIPFSDDEAHVTFYVAILKENKNKFRDLIKIIENYDDY